MAILVKFSDIELTFAVVVGESNTQHILQALIACDSKRLGRGKMELVISAHKKHLWKVKENIAGQVWPLVQCPSNIN